MDAVTRVGVPSLFPRSPTPGADSNSLEVEDPRICVLSSQSAKPGNPGCPG
jgi:hypothetical protein